MFGRIKEALSPEKWIENLEGYLDARIKLAKFDAREAAIHIISNSIIYAALLSVAIIALILLNIGLGLWLGNLTGKYFYGFFILAAFYLLLSGIIFLKKDDKKVRQKLEASIRMALDQPAGNEEMNGSQNDSQNEYT
jgi:hypothetical protein